MMMSILKEIRLNSFTERIVCVVGASANKCSTIILTTVDGSERVISVKTELLKELITVSSSLQNIFVCCEICIHISGFSVCEMVTIGCHEAYFVMIVYCTATFTRDIFLQT